VAVTIRAHTAGKLQALLDFLRPRALERDDDRRVVLVSCGVGAPREDDIELLRQARKLGFEPSLYTLNTRMDAKLLHRLRQAQVREFDGTSGRCGWSGRGVARGRVVGGNVVWASAVAG
jgi:translation initiation factor IF-2